MTGPLVGILELRGSISERANKFLGAFAKLPKAAISYIISVSPFIGMEQLGSHWTDFHEM